MKHELKYSIYVTRHTRYTRCTRQGYEKHTVKTYTANTMPRVEGPQWARNASSYLVAILLSRSSSRRHPVTLALRAPPQPWGVYDRRPSPVMFIARIFSALLALTAILHALPPRNRTLSLPIPNGIHYTHPDGTTLVLQSVPNQNGALLLLHGCSHSATDFFPPTSTCPNCTGLPESLRITQLALSRRLSVIAVSSTNRLHKCWQVHTPTAHVPDYDRIATALRVAAAHSISSPLFVIGISSGGRFATSLPLRFDLAGINLIISPAIYPEHHMYTLSSRPLPPHVFTHMPHRDPITAAAISRAITILTTLRTPAVEFHVAPHPVTPDFLTDAVPSWNSSVVAQLVTALKKAHVLRPDYTLMADPRRSAWREAVSHLRGKLNDSFIADQSPLSEELNRAWARHEITSDYFANALDYLQSKKPKLTNTLLSF